MSESKEEIKYKNDYKVHRLIVIWFFCSTLFLVILLGSVLLISNNTEKELITILPVVVISGILGSFVSALNRIYSSVDVFPIDENNELFKNFNIYLVSYSAIPPLVGAITSSLLYVIFAGGILKGPLFPAFACDPSGDSCTNFINFLKYWSPATSKDYAKVIVWGFLAGFSERLVPDILNKIVSRTNE